ncbi:uncharacterized protein MONOS_9222 [Monocercomonoides exilis]|uniref:uncharacterized protein n=1 Tax=Monocercomonoides exilis TaxID=2049356 RepID=UPI0035598D8F|nr:hypothetical protein MONOS_9222 [Monocercomonoides exilis]|eukprot:MONOS_9222.1-p1 / transcript=MONOS_9222.1 / gene=MONOS_9222 / organism=Monocercomonoides_exilis_PA203 / gene_product=unspecified product / transcript_product=unspecified product / location=Mono_scaffold00372:47092-47449(-) / protein_length=95 / sequence_SO=supercontig / SO=protein_coding / is_pseudo=false
MGKKKQRKEKGEEKMEMWQPTVDYQFVERRNELYGKVEEAIVLLIEKGLVLEKLKLVKAKSEEEIPLKGDENAAAATTTEAEAEEEAKEEEEES